MTDREKIERLEHALRTERDHLRGRGPTGERITGAVNLTAANHINSFLQTASDTSKLRLADLLLSCETPADAAARLQREMDFRVGYKMAADRARAFHPLRIESDKAHLDAALQEYLA